MLLSFEKRFLFVANTKTASTSIESVLRPLAEIAHGGNSARKHIPMRTALWTYRDAFETAGRKPGALVKFGVMRDPLDWIGSWFRYRKGNRVDSTLPEDIDFPAFWARADWNIRRKNGEKHLQRDMFCNQKGRVLADIVIPYPRIDEMFGEICAGLGIDPGRPLPRENRSRIAAAAPLPAELEQEMRAFYAEDYALWERLDEINAPALARLRDGTWPVPD